MSAPPLDLPGGHRLRPLTAADVDDVLALNQAEVERLAPLDRDRLDLLLGWCHRFDVIEADGAFGGFVAIFVPGTDYDSENYRWFSQRYDAFAYLDRIALAPHVRRRGLGTLVYDALEAEAAAYGRMTLEVNTVPENGPSLAFHRGRGYEEVGRLGDAEHEVALLSKPLSAAGTMAR